MVREADCLQSLGRLPGKADTERIEEGALLIVRLN